MSRATLTGYYATRAEGGDIKRLDEKKPGRPQDEVPLREQL